MRNVISQLDKEQRQALLQVADLGTALFASGLIVSILKFVGDLFT
jgi:hypothetical protein